MLAAVEHEETDRIPFWPKLDAAYQSRHGSRLGTNSIEGIHHLFGTDPHLFTSGGYEHVFSEGAGKETDIFGMSRTIVYKAGGRTLAEKHTWDAPSCSWIPVRYPIRTPEDVWTMTQYYLNAEVVPNRAEINACQERMRACPDALWGWTVGQSPLMHFVEWMAGVETAHLLLADVPEAVEALFDAYQQYLQKIAVFAAEHIQADLYYFIENTSTTLISPAQYKRYCAKHIADYGKIFASAGKRMALHMCGHLKKLYAQLCQSPAVVFEAITSPPVGDTTLAEGREALPHPCLIGGTSAVTWLKPLEQITKEIERSLSEMNSLRGVILSSGGVMPPLCKPEMIHAVARWLRETPF